jgi:superfamily II DNA/RNA helicase
MCVLPLIYDKAKFFKLHGKIDQKKRTKIYSKFKSENLEDDKHLVLLTTDLSARGIDIPDVDWIV